jgi:hypothetical protein
MFPYSNPPPHMGEGRVGVRSRWMCGVRDPLYGNSRILARTRHQVIVLCRLDKNFVQVLG